MSEAKQYLYRIQPGVMNARLYPYRVALISEANAR
jgi:hypothetical protein